MKAKSDESTAMTATKPTEPAAAPQEDKTPARPAVDESRRPAAIEVDDFECRGGLCELLPRFKYARRVDPRFGAQSAADESGPLQGRCFSADHHESLHRQTAARSPLDGSAATRKCVWRTRDGRSSASARGLTRLPQTDRAAQVRPSLFSGDRSRPSHCRGSGRGSPLPRRWKRRADSPARNRSPGPRADGPRRVPS